MGHTTAEALSHCLHKCDGLDGMNHSAQPTPIVVISVRNPIDYYLSMYAYTREKPEGSACAQHLIHHHSKKEQADILGSFHNFVQWGIRVFSQSKRIQRACESEVGDLCSRAEVLHTETLDADWGRLLAKYGQPAVAPIALVNPSVVAPSGDSHGHAAATATTSRYNHSLLTQELRDLIWLEEHLTLRRFGYTESSYGAA